MTIHTPALSQAPGTCSHHRPPRRGLSHMVGSGRQGLRHVPAVSMPRAAHPPSLPLRPLHGGTQPASGDTLSTLKW